MEATRVEQFMTKDGEILIAGLPYKKGQLVEVIVLPQIPDIHRSPLTVRRFRHSGLIGMWKDRNDIEDGSVYARHLREQAQQRRHIDYDSAG